MKEDALELVKNRNDFYRDNYRRALLAVLLVLIVNIGLVGVIFYQASNQPQAKYFATSSDGRITPLSPLSQPVVSTSALLQWANQAAVAAYTYNFVTYRKQLQEASEYFTPEGWRNYEKALQGSRNLETVLARKLVVTAVATGAPVVLDQGRIRGRYAWKVQMPVLVSYQSATTTYQQPLTLTLVVVRVSTLNVPKGIAIAQFYASETGGARMGGAAA